MSKIKPILAMLIAFVILPSVLKAQQQQPQSLFQGINIHPSLGAEYFNLALSWDDKAHTSKFKAYLFTLQAEIEVLEGLSLHPIVGYSLSNFDGLVFREIPFSVEMGVGHMGGIALGLGVDKRIFRFPDYELEICGQIVYSFRLWKTSWAIPDINVDGTVKGSPSWLRAQIGPVIRYLGFDYIFPYISIEYHKLWGRFKLEQDIQDLTGLEKKKVSSTNDIILSVGALYEMTNSFTLTGELTFYPHNDGLDIGAMVILKYLF